MFKFVWLALAVVSLTKTAFTLNCTVCGSTSYGSTSFSGCSNVTCSSVSGTPYCYMTISKSGLLQYQSAGCDSSNAFCSSAGVAFSSTTICCSSNYCNIKPSNLTCSICGTTTSGPFYFASCTAPATCVANTNSTPMCFKSTSGASGLISTSSSCDKSNSLCSATGSALIANVKCCNSNLCNPANRNGSLLALLLLAQVVLGLQFFSPAE